MFLFGGHDGARQLNDFYCFNFSKVTDQSNAQIYIATEMWTLVESETALTPSPRDSHILVNSGSSVFLFG